MHRNEIGTARDPMDRPWWLRLFKGEQSPAGYVESHAAEVEDVMSAPAVTVTEDSSVAEIATLFEKHGLKRVPVVEGTRVTGIVSCADLLRALAARRRIPREQRSTSDESICNSVLGELGTQPWSHPGHSNVNVLQGVVHFSGLLDSPDEAQAARVAAENVAGVRGVEDHRLNTVAQAIGCW